jgi:hypothetical protein
LIRAPLAEEERVARQGSVRAFLAVAALLTALAYIYYNITFLQHQGRYLFTALIPIAIFLALGWRSALQPAVGRVLAVILAGWCILLASWSVLTGHGLPTWPLVITVGLAVGLGLASLLSEGPRRWAYALPFALLPMVAVYALFGAIVPALALP